MSDLISLSSRNGSSWKDVDLGAGQLLPLADARVERLILLAADQLGVDGDAVELAGQVGGKRSCPPKQREQHHAGRHAGKQSVHWFLPKARAASAGSHLVTLTNKRFIHIQTKHL